MVRPLAFLRRMRLVHRRDFARAFQSGSRARGEVLNVVVCRNGLEHSRLGLSVGRSVWKGAVERNRVRRIFREAFRLSYPTLPRGLDIILIPAAPRLDPVLAQIEQELCTLVLRAQRQIEAREARSARGTTP